MTNRDNSLYLWLILTVVSFGIAVWVSAMGAPARVFSATEDGCKRVYSPFLSALLVGYAFYDGPRPETPGFVLTIDGRPWGSGSWFEFFSSSDPNVFAVGRTSLWLSGEFCVVGLKPAKLITIRTSNEPFGPIMLWISVPFWLLFFLLCALTVRSVRKQLPEASSK